MSDSVTGLGRVLVLTCIQELLACLLHVCIPVPLAAKTCM